MNGHTTDTLTERDTTNVLHLPLEKKGGKKGFDTYCRTQLAFALMRKMSLHAVEI